MGKVPRRKAGPAVVEVDLQGRFSLNLIRDVSVAYGDRHVVVPMPMHQRCGVRRNLDLEDANIFVLKHEMVRCSAVIATSVVV